MEVASPLPAVPHAMANNPVAMKTISDHNSLFHVITPIKVDKLWQLLQDHPNQPLVQSILRGLSEGVWPYAIIEDDAPDTFDFSSRHIDDNGREFARVQIDQEVALGRFSAPFGPDLLPGMYSSPIGVILKLRSNKFHLVNDLSAGPFAPNSWVPKADIHIKLDNLQHFGAILCEVHKMQKQAPPWLFKSDVHGVYRTWPMHPLWQLKQVITFDGQRYVDRCMEFGQRASP
jgi:hypothetical protein